MALILTLPAGVRNPSKYTWRPVSNTQTMVSALSKATQTLELPGAQWTCEATWATTPMTHWRLWEAFKAQLRGGANRFFCGPWHAATPQGIAGGAPVVNGAGQTGNTLNVRGCTSSQSPWLKVGDYFHFATPDGWQELHLVVGSDVASDGSGHATLTIEPPIRTSPADGAAIVTQSPQCIMRLVSDDMPVEFTPPLIAAFTLNMVEAFS